MATNIFCSYINVEPIFLGEYEETIIFTFVIVNICDEYCKIKIYVDILLTYFAFTCVFVIIIFRIFSKQRASLG